MKRFTRSLRSSVAHRDWYVALTSALTLPDVCGRLIDPTAKTGTRYAAWFDEWMGPLYTGFLGGDDCYALRCSYLHQGESDVKNQKASKVLTDFKFYQPHPNLFVHRNRINNTLQLQVDVFCLEMADAVDGWLESVQNDPDISARRDSLLFIDALVPAIYR